MAAARLQGLGGVADALDDEERGGGVQAGADLVQEQRLLRAHQHLTCAATSMLQGSAPLSTTHQTLNVCNISLLKNDVAHKNRACMPEHP